MTSDDLSVFFFALFVRLCTLALSVVTSAVVPAYDQSTSLQQGVPAVARGVASWDAVYMRHIAQHGYTHEQTHAFYPFYPLVVLRPLSSLAGADPLLVGVLVNLLAFPVSALLLLRLSAELLHDSRLPRSLPRWAALSFAVTPAGIFFTAPYTECLFALASFAGMLFVHRRRRAAAVAAFLVAAALRSNGLLYGGFFLWPHVLRLYTHRSVHPRSLALDLLCAALVLLPTVGVEWYGRALYCRDDAASLSAPRPYCGTWRPAFYSFVQAHYWKQGFLAYWTLQQVPNFVLAAPMAALCVAACCEAVRERAFVTQARAPHVVLLALMLAVALVSTHVQTLTRFVSANPAVYWYAGAQLAARPRRRAWAAAFFGAYTVVGTVLFASFYPWT